MYALKKGIAISPYYGYAIFINEKIEGATHDYEDLKNNYTSLVIYLKKTDSEREEISSDINTNWGITFDKGYQGDESDTIGLRKYVMKRIVKSDEDKEWNKNISKVHVIEQFFGRLKRLWKITSSIYRNDKQSFDIDIDNCILLTNEDIRFRKLVKEDYEYYLGLQIHFKQQTEENNKKRKTQYAVYRLNKKMRTLSSLL